jgi:Flp pilus assembly protein TadB
MAQTKKKRRRKHRGTQAGNIERPGRTGRPSGSRPASRDVARQKRQDRFEKEPTWRGSVNRAAFAAAILAIFVSVIQKNIPAGIVLGIVAMILYVPMSYYTDRALWRRRQRQKQQRGR